MDYKVNGRPVKRQYPSNTSSTEVPQLLKFPKAEEQSSSFYVSSTKYKSLSFPSFGRPAEVDSFSLDINRAFFHDRSMLKRLFCTDDSKSVDYDLNSGYDTFDKRDETVKEHLDDLLRCIMINKNLVRDPPNFVCWRGLLTKILCAPYETRDDWVIAVSRLARTIYMCEFDKAASYPNMALMTYWGFKFEQYVTAKDGYGSPQTEEPVNNKEAFCSVVSTKLNGHSLLYGGEVDCFDGSSADSAANYVELKTNRDFDHPGQERNFRKFKVLKWWAQSFLLGVPTVICGFRDDAGIVHRIGRYRTLELPRLVRGERDMWDPVVCFNFLDDFLAYVKKCVISDDCVYVFAFSAGSACVKTRQCAPAEVPYCFLPSWYKSHILKSKIE